MPVAAAAAAVSVLPARMRQSSRSNRPRVHKKDESVTIETERHSSACNSGRINEVLCAMDSDYKLTPSNEDYLETLLELCGTCDKIRSVDVAEHLNVSKASVNKAMGILRDAALIEQEHYGLIHLTELGRHRASEIMQRHAMIKRFLIEILGIDEVTAEQDACRMEHVISESTHDHWFSYLRRVLSD